MVSCRRPRSARLRMRAPKVQPAIKPMNQPRIDSSTPMKTKRVANGPRKNAVARPIIAHPEPKYPSTPATASATTTFDNATGNVSCCTPKNNPAPVAMTMRDTFPMTPARLSGRYTRTRFFTSPSGCITDEVMDDVPARTDASTDDRASPKGYCVDSAPRQPRPRLCLCLSVENHPEHVDFRRCALPSDWSHATHFRRKVRDSPPKVTPVTTPTPPLQGRDSDTVIYQIH